VTGTTYPHPLTSRCPLSCLEGRLPARIFNALQRHLRWQHSGHPTVGHVAGLHRQGRLGEIRGLGAGGIEVIKALLESAGLLAEPDSPQDQTIALAPGAESAR
jgi:hypothetical protein